MLNKRSIDRPDITPLRNGLLVESTPILGRTKQIAAHIAAIAIGASDLIDKIGESIYEIRRPGTFRAAFGMDTEAVVVQNQESEQ